MPRENVAIVKSSKFDLVISYFTKTETTFLWDFINVLLIL
jgi:hypothetical protein